MQVVWPFGIRLSYVCINDGCMALCNAEIFMTGSQPLLSSLCNRGYLSIHLRPLLQNWCRWHQRKRKAQHTPAAGASMCFHFGVNIFWTFKLFTKGNTILHVFSAVICSSLVQCKLSFGATSTNIFILFLTIFLKTKHFFCSVSAI